jgi:hypothetical protein
MERDRVNSIPQNPGNLCNLQHLNETINTEISAGEEKSVSQKISDQPTFLFKTLPHFSDDQIKNPIFSKSLKLGVNYICNGSLY